MRLGRSCARHPLRVLAAWAVVVAIAVVSVLFGAGEPRDDYQVDSLQATEGLRVLQQEFPAAAGAGAQVVLDAGDGQLSRGQLERATTRLRDVPLVTQVVPRVSSDQGTALFTVTYSEPVTDPRLLGNVEDLEQAMAPLEQGGLTVEYGGEVPESGVADVEGIGEAVGVAAALVILLVLFRSVLAAGVPLITAGVGLGVGLSAVLVLAGFTTISTSAPQIAVMVGLGVGIDYALLLLSRHREELAAGHPVTESAGIALSTAGRSVLFAGGTVLVSLLGLRFSGVPAFNSYGYATAVTVIAVVAAALTLVPAFLGLLGERMTPKASGAHAPDHETETSGWAAALARRIVGRPWPYAVVATLLMVLLALPVLDLRTWPQDASMQSTDASSRRAADLTADAFGPGAGSLLTVVVPTAGDAAQQTQQALEDVDGQVLGPAVPSPSGSVALLTVQPPMGATDPGFPAYVDEVRAALPAEALVTGRSAIFRDFNDLLADGLVRVVGFVIAVSLLFLMVIFRSIVVPLKAAAMNLLSIGAAYGVIVLVFQRGVGLSLVGLDQTVPISSFIPVLMFAVLFGLSMDYEVFLLSRVREHWLRHGDHAGSIVEGLAGTARVISAAAAIMIAVFLGFAAEGDVIIKQIALGMAVAIFLDATVVRLVLVPSVMAILGRTTWWLPGWLDRALPQVDVEG